MKTKSGLIIITLGTLLSAGANASSLQPRLGGLAFYDDDAGLTWLTNANAGAGSIFDDGISATDGRMSWANANAWAANLTVNGVSGWRLANTSQPDASCDGPGADITISHGLNCTGSEMGNLFYNALGNAAGSLTNSGSFSNIQGAYWSATEFVTDTSRAWNFVMSSNLNSSSGNQGSYTKVGYLSAWAVRSGDVSAVPVPAAVWLFSSGLIGLIGLARRKH